MGLNNWISVARSLLTNAPSYLIFQVTSKCNSRCLTCFNWKRIDSPEKNDLTLDEIEKISENYGRVLQLTLGGGEPFLRDDIADICLLFDKNNSVQHITIATNCLLPHKIKKVVENILLRCNLNYLKIGLSLDGIGEEHDRLRGVPGNYKKVLETYSYLTETKRKHSNLGLDISSVLSALNKDSIHTTIDTVKWQFPEIDKHAVVAVRGDAREKASKDIDAECYMNTLNYLKQANATKSKNLVARIFKALFNINSEMVYGQLKTGRLSIPCLAGQRLIVITPDGEVYPCEGLDQSIGNLREFRYQMQTVLESERAQKLIKFIRERGCSCSWECAFHASLVFNVKHYPKILYRTFFQN